MFCNIGYRYYKCVNFLANESKIYVLIYRIQLCRCLNCKRIEDLFKKGCEELQKLSRKSNSGYTFDSDVFVIYRIQVMSVSRVNFLTNRRFTF